MLFLESGGGLFLPLSQFSTGVRTFAHVTPLPGLNQLIHDPLVAGPFQWTWVADLGIWLTALVSAAIWLLRRDPRRE